MSMLPSNENNMAQKLKILIHEIFELPADSQIEIHEHQSDQHVHTDIIFNNGAGENSFTIKKTLNEISREDIVKLKKFVKLEKMKKYPIVGSLFRFFGLWFAFAGVYSLFAVCPFCGQAGCPVGAGSVGVVGGFFAFIVQYGKSFLNFMKTKLAFVKR